MSSYDSFENLITRYASPGIRPGLDRIKRLLNLLGNPEGKFPSIHVVGTNGKGSTCAFLVSVFQAAGYRTALYTSPHLESPGERLLINGTPLPPERWCEAAEKVISVLEIDPFLQSDPPSYFELVTAVAFLLTASEGIDIAIVEAGLGGRLDATNLLSHVVLTAVTSISMDHIEYLGTTLEAIAGEKFAVVRPGIPACYLGDREELIPLFKEYCLKAQAFPVVVSQEAQVIPTQLSPSGSVFDFSLYNSSSLSKHSLNTVQINLLGHYQLSNASLALTALLHLRPHFDRLTDSAIRKGLEKAKWPGRIEIINTTNPVLVLDGGHNPDGVSKLVDSVKMLWPGQSIGIVYAVMKDKEHCICLEHLSTLNPALYVTCVPEMERSLSPQMLLKEARSFKWRKDIETSNNPLEAIRAASQENDVVLVCGSLYLIGWVRSHLHKELLKQD